MPHIHCESQVHSTIMLIEFRILFRDSRENPKQLNPDEVMEIAFKENSRLTPLSNASSYSPRRERALKIYLDTK